MRSFTFVCTISPGWKARFIGSRLLLLNPEHAIFYIDADDIKPGDVLPNEKCKAFTYNGDDVLFYRPTIIYPSYLLKMQGGREILEDSEQDQQDDDDLDDSVNGVADTECSTDPFNAPKQNTRN